MNKRRKIGFVVILLLAILAIASGLIVYAINRSTDKEFENEEGRLKIVTSFFPMYIATMNITDGVNGIELDNLSEPETGCLHDYQLTTADMKLLSTADVFVVNGGGIEEFLEDVARQCPNLTNIDASEGIDIVEDNGHVWMSVSNYETQVNNIAKGLSKVNENNADKYMANASSYRQKLDGLLVQISQEYAGKPVVLFSEAYEYIAKDFDLDVKGTLDLDEEKDVSAKELADTVSLVRDKQVPLIIAEKQYGEKMANKVMAETDVQVVYLDTIIRGDYDKDAYINRMGENIRLLREALSK